MSLLKLSQISQTGPNSSTVPPTWQSYEWTHQHAPNAAFKHSTIGSECTVRKCGFCSHNHHRHTSVHKQSYLDQNVPTGCSWAGHRSSTKFGTALQRWAWHCLARTMWMVYGAATPNTEQWLLTQCVPTDFLFYCTYCTVDTVCSSKEWTENNKPVRRWGHGGLPPSNAWASLPSGQISH